MADFGVTPQGFILKRFEQLLVEKRLKAIQLFQDMVSPGDVVDTSDSSLLGRLINLDVDGDAALWELAQQVYSAFDPNSATGIALDNLVQYGGISRFGASPSTAQALFVGDVNTLIPTGSAVTASDSNAQFTVISPVALSPSVASGVVVSVNSVLSNTNYSITYTTGLTSSNTVTFNSGATPTTQSILAGLAGLITLNHPLLTAMVVGNTLVVDKEDIFQTSTFSVSAYLTISKAKKLGELVAVVNGPQEQETATINTITTPVLGWDSVYNVLPTSLGRFVETDEELRIRFRNTKLQRSSNILDSLYSALNNLNGVEEVAVYENDTDVVDENGIPAHSFMPVVLGGSSQLIAEAIWENKPMGISSEGNTSVVIIDSQGFPHTVSFERPNPTPIYIDIELSLNPEDDNVFPGDGPDLIRLAIIDYADRQFGVGDDVIFSRLYTPINSIPGHQVDSLFIGTSPNPASTSNIVIPFNGIASFQSVNINITVNS